MIEFFGVKPDRRDPNGFFEIIIGSQRPLPEYGQVVIERPGQQEAYLATKGWQANYAYLEITICQDNTSLLGLRLSRNLMRFFQSGYNYKISLFDLNQAELGFLVISWDLGDDVVVPPHPIPPEPPPPSPDPLPGEPTPAPQIEVLAPREVIRCKGCGHEVFSTFLACPFCGTSLG